jgi:tetratricopeptide (TPR) repeat protein
MAQEKTDSAVCKHAKILASEPKNCKALSLLGSAFEKQGSLDKALYFYQRFVDHCPKINRHAHAMRRMLGRYKKTKDAIAAISPAVREALVVDMLKKGKAAHEKGKTDEALCWCAKALAFEPQDKQLLTARKMYQQHSQKKSIRRGQASIQTRLPK